MKEKTVRNSVILIAASVVVVFFVFLLRQPPTQEAEGLVGLKKQFLRILPADLSEKQKIEVTGILNRFEVRARGGLIQPQDQDDVVKNLRTYVEAGSISRADLNRFMVDVSFYTNRLDPAFNLPDSTVKHPYLLEEEADTTSGR